MFDKTPWGGNQVTVMWMVQEVTAKLYYHLYTKVKGGANVKEFLVNEHAPNILNGLISKKQIFENVGGQWLDKCLNLLKAFLLFILYI